MIRDLIKKYPNVTVVSFEGLLVDFAKEIDANIIIRGLRAVTDFEYELQIAQTNHVENSELETIFLKRQMAVFSKLKVHKPILKRLKMVSLFLTQFS